METMGRHVIAELWQCDFDKLNDMEFWNKYVLLKTESKYKYLTEIR